RREKPKVSGFSSARIDRILAVAPDLVLAFSDLQADMCRDLVKAGIEVHLFNQRSVEGILAMVECVGRLVGAQLAADALVARLEGHIASARRAAAQRPRRPRVYFEEWDEPPISGIRWVSELIDLAGGDDVYAEQALAPNAAQRIVADPLQVVHKAPDIIIGSWCGKKFRPEKLAARPGWDAIPAVRDGQLHEIKSADILAPGPSAIRLGLPQLMRIFDAWQNARPGTTRQGRT
ncbi:MAG: ABC transporter substrate-binding protein, partial [Rhodocyclaceae bacterium]|nr:ABC transporter substrate-binding protein [Rhodocyclaceae bacterium]